ncbi:MAG: hypothetical protein E7J78_03040 [Pantoea sp.]|jgi:hypothetical protein|nr:hypothetical protein [Pantoea sp.]
MTTVATERKNFVIRLRVSRAQSPACLRRIASIGWCEWPADGDEIARRKCGVNAAINPCAASEIAALAEAI